MLAQFDTDTAHASDLVRSGADMQGNTKLPVHALLHVFQILKAAKVLEPLYKPAFLVPGQSKYAQVAVWRLLQLVATARASGWRARLANR